MKKDRKIQLFLNIILIILSSLIVIPFLILLGISFSSEKDIVEYGYRLFPKHFDLSAYRYIFKNPDSIFQAYKVTAIFSVVATLLSVLLMSMIAYPLSKRNLKGKRAISFYLYFTMLFSGGLVPSYILITQYFHLGDTIWVYILPGLISPWYIFMIRTFLQDLPYEITESMYIDGADEYMIFIKLVLPLSKPVLATVALMMFLAKWNDWQISLLYINDPKLVSIQYLLQKIMSDIKLLQDSSMNLSGISGTVKIPTETVRMAMAVVVAGPALIVFPFFQKYFVKGLTVGSVKG